MNSRYNEKQITNNFEEYYSKQVHRNIETVSSVATENNYLQMNKKNVQC